MKRINTQLKKYIVVGKRVEKSRWDWCQDVAVLVGRKTIQISTLMKGMNKEQIKGFYKTAKTYTDARIKFWMLWDEHKPR